RCIIAEFCKPASSIVLSSASSFVGYTLVLKHLDPVLFSLVLHWQLDQQDLLEPSCPQHTFLTYVPFQKRLSLYFSVEHKSHDDDPPYRVVLPLLVPADESLLGSHLV
ncbi:hypothetical protein ALC62_08065, partial [Cyphomyrmex costatus]